MYVTAWSAQIRSLFWSVFSCIRTECGETKVSKFGVFSGLYFPAFGLSISPYSIRMRKNTNQKKTRYLDTFHAVCTFHNKYHLYLCFICFTLLTVNFSYKVPWKQLSHLKTLFHFIVSCCGCLYNSPFLFRIFQPLNLKFTGVKLQKYWWTLNINWKM